MIALELGTIIAGRYRLERAVARGGMGAVWRAWHLQLDVAVAIKFMVPEYAASAEARERFEREAKAAAHLRVPNVVHVYDYGVENEVPYIVMEFLDGEDLEARLARQGRLSIAATQRVLNDVGKALRRAHEVGLVHRDLKPGNIFIARHAGEEIVKVLDFGIAKVSGLGQVGSVTKTGTLLGSPHYMSPEQVRRRKDVDHRSDLWALGVIAFRCLTGQLPFPSEEVGDVLVEICTADIPRPSLLAPDLGPSVDRFLTRALTRDPDQRFQNVDELVNALAGIAAVTGAPPAPSYRARPMATTEDATHAFAIEPITLVVAAAEPVTVMAAPLFDPASGAAPTTQLAPVPAPASVAPAAYGARNGRTPAGATLAGAGRTILSASRSTQVGVVILGVTGTLLIMGVLAFALLGPREPDAAPSSMSPVPSVEPSAPPVEPIEPAASVAPIAPSAEGVGAATAAAPGPATTPPAAASSGASGAAKPARPQSSAPRNGRPRNYDPLNEM